MLIYSSSLLSCFFLKEIIMMKAIINLMNEIGMLAKTPRSGFAFLGSGSQSVAEHSYRVTVISHLLADLFPEKIDKHRLLLLCLFHDLMEARTGDLNYVNKRYVHTLSEKALNDIQSGSPYGQEIVSYIHEYENCQSSESKLAHDADQLELLLVLKQEFDTGNPRAMDWFDVVCERLITETAKELAKEIKQTPFDAWWLKDKQDPHWIKKKTHQQDTK